MNFENIAVLTSRESWFIPYAEQFVDALREKGYHTGLFHNYKDIDSRFQIVFMLSYFSIVEEKYLKKHKHNLVVHESGLPQGKGWAPLFWQILEGKNKIPSVLFEVTAGVDAGDIYISDYITLQGHELHDEIRELQAKKSVEMCMQFLENYDELKPVSQSGKETFYARRTPKDSQLDINKSISEQFNLLRIASNEDHPAFFHHKGSRYILKIFKEE
jgi:methionyl-tRNA formyltransferase